MASAANGSGSPPRSLSVAVIGAGAGGLASARELLREGHRVEVLEAGGGLGGTWQYSDEVEDDLLGTAPGRRVHGSLYAGLRTNLPRQLMGYLDYPFDAEFPGSKDPRTFPGHNEVLRYLQAYAAEHGLLPHLRLRTAVTALRPLRAPANGSAGGAPPGWAEEPASSGSAAGGDGPPRATPAAGPRWAVATQRRGRSGAALAGSEEEREYDAVVVASGHFAEPHVPRFPGQAVFPGVQMHSHNYRRAEAFAGQSVLLVGASASGMDIAAELAATARRVYLCARSWENPLTGEPLPGPPGGDGTAVLRSANLAELRPDGGAALVDGTLVPHVDCVMYCTGYLYRFPFLDADGEASSIVSTAQGHVAPLYRHLFPPRVAPTLSFIGLTFKVVPFPQMQLQARWVARILSGRVALPSVQEMEADCDDFYASLARAGIAPQYTHRQAGAVQWQYADWLAEAMGPDEPRVPAWRAVLYEAAGAIRRVSWDGYRDAPLDSLPGVAEALAAAAAEAAALRAGAASESASAQRVGA